MQKRSIARNFLKKVSSKGAICLRHKARKASVAARHALLKARKRQVLRNVIRGLQAEIGRKDRERLVLISELRASKAQVLKQIIGEEDAVKMQENLALLISDTSRAQAMLENVLKRKKKQLDSLEKRKR